MDLSSEDILETQDVDGVIVARFVSGKIRDEKRIFRAFESLNRYVDQQQQLKMVLNLTKVEYLSSAGLGYLVGLLKKISTNEGTLRLCELRDSIVEIFDIMRLTQIFDIYDSEAEALQAFGVKSTVTTD